jgi:hypothetical protein
MGLTSMAQCRRGSYPSTEEEGSPGVWESGSRESGVGRGATDAGIMKIEHRSKWFILFRVRVENGFHRRRIRGFASGELEGSY